MQLIMVVAAAVAITVLDITVDKVAVAMAVRQVLPVLMEPVAVVAAAGHPTDGRASMAEAVPL